MHLANCYCQANGDSQEASKIGLPLVSLKNLIQWLTARADLAKECADRAYRTLYTLTCHTPRCTLYTLKMNSAHLGEVQWRTAKMSWSRESPPESVGGPQRCLFQRDFAYSVPYASRLTPIVCKKSSGTASCLS